ncbi:MAG TPA: aliphatic sulfonate ABC transporter substrate-binding protein [Tepidisphaeraceae bacterium]|jgi:NitT/TauT family transport system substrate-binding protein|nr:aliphatic sulfonate ABC transporter substrate-binding protein [Tepidisphaeraceae bacterium]
MRIKFIASLLAIMAVTGCGSKESASVATNQQTAPSEVTIGYFANLTHAQAVLGVSSGEFATAIAPATLKTKVFNAGPSLIEALIADQIDIGYVGPGPVLTAYARGGGDTIRVIAGAAANGVAIVAGKDSGINTLADLKGKKLATPQLGNTQDISAKHYLLSVLHQDNVDNVVPVANNEQLQLLASGKIDAAWAPEPWGSRLLVEAGGKLIAEEKDTWPDKKFTLTLVIARPKFLKEHPDIVEKILKVHAQWTQRLSTEPDKYKTQLGDALAGLLAGKKLPPGVVDQALPRVEFTDEPLADTLTTMAQWSYELHVVKQPPKLTDLVDTSLLKEAEKSIR